MSEQPKLITDKDIPYGTLNPIPSRSNPDRQSLDLNSYSFLQSLKRTVKRSYEHDALSSFTEFKAITLAVLNEETVSSFFSSLNKTLGIKSDTLKIIAKIPEIHSHLPSPRSDTDFEILSLYPIFEGHDDVVPSPGDIIRVTFQNIINQSGPIYLGKITGEGNIVGNIYSEPTRSKDLFVNPVKFGPGTRGFTQPGIEDVGFIGYNRNGQSITQIVLHESVSSSKERTITSLLTSKSKQGESMPLSVHFIISPNGIVSQHLPIELAGVHADGNGEGHNIASIGVEIVNLVNVTYTGMKNKILQNVPWVDKHIYVVPPTTQLEATWQLMQKLSSSIGGVQFPACQINGNSASFTWGRWSGHRNAIGIMAHCRWGHSDALYIEHYCLARHLGFNVEDAATITYIKASQTTDHFDISGPLVKSVRGTRTTTMTLGKLK